MSLAAFLCFSGGGASCVAAVEAAVVAVVAIAAGAVGGLAFGFGLGASGGCDLDALVALGGGISLIVWSSDISEWCI